MKIDLKIKEIKIYSFRKQIDHVNDYLKNDWEIKSFDKGDIILKRINGKKEEKKEI